MNDSSWGLRSTAAISVAGLAVGSGFWTSPGGAFPNDHRVANCDDDGLGFIKGDNMNAHWADWIDGAERWNELLDEDGDQWYFNGIGNEWTVDRFDLGGGKRGRTTCEGGLINIDFVLDDGVAVGAETEHVAAHEAGHGHGMRHTQSAGLTATDSAMETCDGGVITPNLDRDDWAYAAEENGVTLHANSSFEHGTTHWGSSNMTLTGYNDLTTAEGDKAVRLDATSLPSSIYQTQRYIRPDEDGAGHFNARVNYKDANANVSGTITLTLEVRRLDFPANSTVCNYAGDLNLLVNPTYLSTSGGPNPGGVYSTVKSKVISVTDGWDYENFSGSYTSAASWDGVDVRVRVYKNTNGPIFLDHTRAYQT